MNKRNLIYTGLLMLAMVTSPVSAKETSVSVVHGTANFNEGNASIVIQANQNQSMQGKSFKYTNYLMRQIQRTILRFTIL